RRHTRSKRDWSSDVCSSDLKSNIITGADIEGGDVIVGLPSNGVHSNGFSLVRKITEHLDLQKQYEGLSRPLGEALLEPTKVYVRSEERRVGKECSWWR